MNQRVVDRIREVADWEVPIGRTGWGMRSLARQLRDMLDEDESEPAATPQPSEPQYSQREVLIVQTAARLIANGFGVEAVDALHDARALLDAFDADRDAIAKVAK